MKKHLFTIDLFCGGGGFSAGASQVEGAEVILAIDSWDRALAVHAVNHPKAKHVLMDLGGDVEVFATNLEAFLKKRLPEGATWHLHGSPPCQSFSLANTIPTENDPRSNLTLWYLSLVQRMKPPSYSMEQVPASLPFLRKSSAWLFQSGGPKIYPKVFGKEFGAPTLRKRLYLGEGWSLDDKTYEVRAGKTRKRETSCCVVDILPEFLEEFAPLGAGDIAIRTSQDTTTIRNKAGKNGFRNIEFERGEGLRSLDMPYYAIICKGCKLKFFERVDRDIPYSGRPKSHKWKRLERFLSLREKAIIQGFPRSYQIQSGEHKVRFAKSIDAEAEDLSIRVTNTDICRIIGNSVIPKVSEAIVGSSAKEARKNSTVTLN